MPIQLGTSDEGLRLQLLGPLTIHRGGSPVAQPPSRKARALIAYLALAPRAVSRDHLCELLWDLPNDPRGELRGSLSKARGVLDESGRKRLVAGPDGIRLDLTDVGVDVLELNAAAQAGFAALDAPALRALSARFVGEFLEGLEIPRSAAYSAWLVGQRRRLRGLHAALLEQLASALPPGSEAALDCLSKWLQLVPFDRRAHEQLFDTLARRGQLREGEEHLAATIRLFEAESQDAGPVARAWREAKTRHQILRAPVRAEAACAPAELASTAPHRASIAVMPFEEMPPAADQTGLGHFLAHDVTMRLAKLRSMFVIAQGSASALDARGLGAEEAARVLNVDYVASATLRRTGDRLSVAAQLVEARTTRIVWADVLSASRGDTLAVLDEIGDHLVSAFASQVELAERNRAILKPPSLLDAWEAHHRGLWHMYRFRRDENELARHFFETALRLDPSFSRPYAGLSFTHFQNAFQSWGDRESETELAYRFAAQGALADDQDPAVRLALGRAHWLRGSGTEALTELEASVQLSPNFSLGHYTLGFVQAQSGDAEAAIRSADHARELSPFDPMLFAMLATRAIALMRLGNFDEAADWATKAIARPNAHVHIRGIAAHCLALAGRTEDARRVTATIRSLAPAYRVDDLLAAFRFEQDAVSLIRRAAPRIGLG